MYPKTKQVSGNSYDGHHRSKIARPSAAVRHALGRALRSHAPADVYPAVERLRRGYIQLRRKDDPQRRKRMLDFIEQLPESTLAQVTRAFSIYFSLTNTAEEAFQHNRRRDVLRRGTSDGHGTFEHAIAKFSTAGMSAQQLQALLNQLQLVPVFTAHPTEARRRTVMESLRRLRQTSEQLDSTTLNRDEKHAIEQDIETQIQVLWQTDEVRSRKPRVTDEINNGLYYFSQSIFAALPARYRQLKRAVEQHYQPGSIQVPSFVRFGSWIGGDRDGNPFVTARTTVSAVLMQSRTVLLEYRQRVEVLGMQLTQSESLTETAVATALNTPLKHRIARAAFADDQERLAGEPYRRKLAAMRYRLSCNLEVIEQRLHGYVQRSRGHPYVDAEEFHCDLALIRD